MFKELKRNKERHINIFLSTYKTPFEGEFDNRQD